MDRPTKRRRLQSEPEPVLNANPQPPVPRYRGKDFTANITHLAQGTPTTVGSVTAQLKIPYAIGPDMANARGKEVDIFGTYSVLPRFGDEAWTQGMMVPMGTTSYFDVNEVRGPSPGKYKTGKKAGQDRPGPVIGRPIVGRAVPLDLDLKTATVESRAMKFLAIKAAKYTPKAPGDDVLFDDASKTGYLGGLTMGSYVEEITGKRSVGIGNTGSGMRAMTLASKWRMKTAGTTSEAGFGRKLLESFPQLGKGGLEQAVKDAGWNVLTHHGGTKPLMGASALDDEVRLGGANALSVYQHHQGMKGSVYKAHVEAREAAKRRFDQKLTDFKAGADPATLGQQWHASQGFLSGLDLGADRQRIKEARADYVARKLKKHNVEHVLGPRALAKKHFKEQGLATVDKALDPQGYKREKHAYVKATLTAAGFNTAKLDASRQAKDAFAAKFNNAQKGSVVPGKWWASKAGMVDFTKLDDLGRKALKQEYVARKTGKIPK
ncbi:hypothetical protein QWZ03_16195 [Chitinimonas viridis]|uniref:Uncharacterized protein n=1 Tax=Chitinimonas viridis TaxID=664880 RepID=A0ABT8B8E2_9NEIS|nr:hypothetical protein [Chitinimonas viridis]MDN3578310.1 hypothetical protein [Chitinimonas viridis]